MKYVDPDGRKIRVKEDLNNFKNNIKDAISYLMKSSTAKYIMDSTILSENNIIDFYYVATPSLEGYVSNTITWCPEKVPYSNITGNYNSSAINLFHEIVHCWIDITEDGQQSLQKFINSNKDVLLERWTKIKDSWEKKGKTFEQYCGEEFTTLIERKVAKDLGECVGRSSYLEYQDDFCLVFSVTKFGSINLMAD